jgi:hypothetical protein
MTEIDIIELENFAIWRNVELSIGIDLHLQWIIIIEYMFNFGGSLIRLWEGWEFLKDYSLLTEKLLNEAGMDNFD